MKTTKKAISLILALVMLMALCTPPIFADNSTESFNIVSFGASNTMGYGLHGFMPVELYNDPSVCYKGFEGMAVAKDGYFTSGYLYYPTNCFPMLIKDELQEELGSDYEVNLNQCAINSMRAYDLRYLLDPTQPADDYIRWRLGDGTEGSGWIYDIEKARDQTVSIAGELYNYKKDKTDIRAQFKSSVETADLIVYDLGVNDFGVYLANRIADGNYDADFSNIIGSEYADYFYMAREQLHNLVMSLGADKLDADTLEQVDFYLDTLAYAYFGFITSFDASMKIIYDLNDDVDIVVVSIQNLIDGINLKLGDVTLPLGDIFAAVLNMANTYTSVLSPYSSRYSYADVRSDGHVDFFADELLRWDGDPAHLSQNMKDCFDAYDSAFLTTNNVRDRVNAYCNASGIEIGSEKYNELLNDCRNAAYYGMAKAALKGITQNDLSFDELYLGQFNDRLRQMLYQLPDNDSNRLYTTAVEKLCAGEDYDSVLSELDSQINALINTESGCSNVHLFMIAGYANCFFYHPTPEGHLEIKEAIMKAYKDKLSGRYSFLNAIGELGGDMTSSTVKYGMQVPIAIIEKLADTFNLDAQSVEVLTSYIGSDDFAALVCSYLGIDDAATIALLAAYSNEVISTLNGHELKRVPAKSASLFSTGNIEYYKCTDCGELFYDAAGTQPIDDPDSINTPKLSIFDFIMNFINRFFSFSGFGNISFGK